MKLIRKNTLHHVCIYRFALYNDLKKKKNQTEACVRTFAHDVSVLRLGGLSNFGWIQLCRWRSLLKRNDRKTTRMASVDCFSLR